MKNNERVKKIVGIAILAAIVAVLQFLSNYIRIIPTVSITLALVPIVVGAIVYGPLAGLILGMVCGFIIVVTGSAALFFNFAPVWTVIVCLLKTGLAGLAAGYIYKAFENKHKNLGIVLSALAVPVINTGLFLVAALTIFKGALVEYSGDYANYFVYCIAGLIGFNFIVEFLVNAMLSSSIVYLINIIKPHQEAK